MIKIDIISEMPDVSEYLEKRNLLKQYKKAKNFILSGHPELVNFKLREPKDQGVYYFRINRQFKVFGNIFEELKEGKIIRRLYVFDIDNHQN